MLVLPEFFLELVDFGIVCYDEVMRSFVLLPQQLLIDICYGVPLHLDLLGLFVDVLTKVSEVLITETSISTS